MRLSCKSLDGQVMPDYHELLTHDAGRPTRASWRTRPVQQDPRASSQMKCDKHPPRPRLLVYPEVVRRVDEAYLFVVPGLARREARV